MEDLAKNLGETPRSPHLRFKTTATTHFTTNDLHLLTQELSSQSMNTNTQLKAWGEGDYPPYQHSDTQIDKDWVQDYCVFSHYMEHIMK